MFDLLKGRNTEEVLLGDEGLSCLRSLITNCQFLSLEILTVAPALTALLYKLHAVVFSQINLVGGQTAEEVGSGLSSRLRSEMTVVFHGCVTAFSHIYL